MRAPARTTPVPPRRGGRGPGARRPPRAWDSARRGRARPGRRAGPQQQVGARGARVRRGHPSPFRSPPSTYPAAGRRARVGGVGRLVHLPGRGPRVRAGSGAPWRAPAGRRDPRWEAWPASAPPGGRLHLWSESPSHVGGRCGGRGGSGAGLGASLWEGAVPCPAGAVVSPLKKPAPHCSRTAAAGSRGRPARRVEAGTVAPAPGRCHPRMSRWAAAPAGSWRGESQREAAVGAGGAGTGREHTDGQPGHWASGQPTASCQRAPAWPARGCQVLRDQNQPALQSVTQMRQHPPETSIPSSPVCTSCWPRRRLFLLPLLYKALCAKNPHRLRGSVSYPLYFLSSMYCPSL